MFGYVVDDVFMQHCAPAGHPERQARFVAAKDALAQAVASREAQKLEVRVATGDELHMVHRSAHIAQLQSIDGKTGWLDPDTYFSPGTYQAALLAAGASAELALRTLRGDLHAGVAIVRPPGHHATADKAMGFCLVNNVAVAAMAARQAGARKVAIVDWDVHHGNGTQDIFWDDPSVLYISTHQYPYYPGTGAPTEIGGANAKGTTVNVGLPAGSTDDDYLAVFDHVVVPALQAFGPDLILVSAGFDAYVDDPIAGMMVTQAGFASLADRVVRCAKLVCDGRVVAVLEGGYDLGGIGAGVTELVAQLAGPAAGRAEAPPSLAAVPVLGQVRAAMMATARAHQPVSPWAANLLRRLEAANG